MNEHPEKCDGRENEPSELQMIVRVGELPLKAWCKVEGDGAQAAGPVAGLIRQGGRRN